MRFFSIIFILLCVLQCKAEAPKLLSHQFTATDGLPNHTVRDIFQDSHGFIWLATLNGLTKYDGTRFYTYRNIPGDSLSLSDNRVYSLREDHDNFLWIQTTGRSFNCFDLRKGKFVVIPEVYAGKYNNIYISGNGDVWFYNNECGALRVKHSDKRVLTSEIFNTKLKKLPSDNVTTIYETIEGYIFIGTSSGIAIIRGNDISVIPSKKGIFSFFQIKDNIYAIANEGGIYQIKGNKLDHIASPESDLHVTGCLAAGDIIVILAKEDCLQFNPADKSYTIHPDLKIKNGYTTKDNKGRNWIYNHSGKITYFSEKNKKFKTLELMPSKIIEFTDHERYRVAEDSEGLIWISTYGNGLFAFDESNDSLYHFNAKDNMLIGSNSIRGMNLDNSGMLWLGTGHSGVSTLWKDNRKIKLTLLDKNSDIDKVNSVRLIYSPDGESVVISNKEGKLYLWKPGFSEPQILGSYPASIYSILHKDPAFPIIGTRGEGLYIGNKQYRHIEGDNLSLPDDNIFFIHPDRKHRIWIGTFGGGIAMVNGKNPGNLSFKSFISDIHLRNQLRCLVEDKDGRFWIGTSEGIVTFHPDSLIRNPQHYKVYSKNNGTLECNEVRSLFRDSRGLLWIATGNNGVISALTSSDGKLDVIDHFTTSEGLTDNSVQSLIEDNFGYIWIGTEYGLSKYDNGNKIFYNIILPEGPQENTFAENSVVKLQNGILLFGTGKGILEIDPKKHLKPDSLTAELRFSHISINGSGIDDVSDMPLNESIDYTEKLVLNPHQNSFSLDFSINDYRSQELYRYTHFLEGYDKEWSIPSSDHTLSYSNIPSGKYLLKVKCLQGSKVIAERELSIIVKTNWWKTTTAIVVYLCIIILSCIIIFSRFKKSKAKTNGEELSEKQATDVFFPKVTTSYTDTDAEFVGKLKKVALENISNSEFSVDDFACAMNMGRAVFYRKLKNVTGTTPNEYLKKMRLTHAADLLLHSPNLTIQEIADKVGFSDSLYFSKCFKNEYGLSPTSYRKR